MPDAWETLRDRKATLDGHFLAKRIGEPTYRVSLKILGFTDAQIKDELRDRFNEMGRI